MRCVVQPPYWDLVGVDPRLDQMRKVVCLDLMRPELPPGWEQTEPTRSLARYKLGEINFKYKLACI